MYTTHNVQSGFDSFRAFHRRWWRRVGDTAPFTERQNDEMLRQGEKQRHIALSRGCSPLLRDKLFKLGPDLVRRLIQFHSFKRSDQQIDCRSDSGFVSKRKSRAGYISSVFAHEVEAHFPT